MAALAAYMGSSWERARRAFFDVKVGRQRVSNLKQAAARERLHAIIIVGIAILVIFLIARHG
ncbi:hypothetical protein J4573_20000 [Actinomadura barringtoniae]|uniref:Uncharacterized protein n=1 Tax=Actinomadura barringtoniae TaxID=1427535 RepID=A0A939TAS6_9ACTN|nr:hypothetical protein [Actinomadura barringtoniae]MBO2449395.1 hypothetical protein [Actinomadura barringtoniae]